MTVVAAPYLLFDNRTWAAVRGRDWDLKFFSESIAADTRLKSAFVRYSNDTSAQGHPRDFDVALGGFPHASVDSQGYLLCITLQTRDLAGRPSWAVVGFWLESCEHLLAVLEHRDPVAAARSINDSAEPKPLVATLPLRGVGISAVENLSLPLTFARGTAVPTLVRFQSAVSAEQVRQLLLERIRHDLPLPSILGIASFRRLDNTRLGAYDLVLAQPVEAGGEAVLTRAQETSTTQPAPYPSAPQPLPKRQEPAIQPSYRHDRTQRLDRSWDWRLLILTVAALLILLLVSSPGTRSTQPAELPPVPSDDSSSQRQAPAEFPPRPPPVDSPDRVAIERDLPNNRVKADLEILRKALALFRQYKPARLDDLELFRITTDVPLAPQHSPKQKMLTEALTDLYSLADSFKKTRGNSVAFFLENPAIASDAERLRRIRGFILETPLKVPDCARLIEAFSFAFERESQGVAAWCEAVELLKPVFEEGGY